MKLCNFFVGDEIHVGAETSRGVVDVTAAGVGSDMNGVIANADIALPLIAAICADETLPVVEAALCKRYRSAEACLRGTEL